VSEQANWTTYDVAGIDDWKSLGEYFINAFDDGTREWTLEMPNLEPGDIQWRPFPNGHSIGSIVLHIASVEVGWIWCTLGGREYPPELRARLLADQTDVDAVEWPEAPDWTWKTYLDAIAEVRAMTKEVLTQPFDPSLFHDNPRWKSRFSNRWVLSHTLTHESYHGGQAVLLALMRQASRATQ